MRSALAIGFIKYLSRQSRIYSFALGLVLIVVITVSDYLTFYALDLSVLYLVPICFISWTLGRSSGIAFSVLALAAWFINNQVISHLLPHSFLLYPYAFPRLWKALVLLVTWIIVVIMLEKLKAAQARADERFATVVEGLYEAVYVVDRETGELLYLNHRCQDAFGAGEPLTHSRQIEAQLQSLPASHDEDLGEEVFAAAGKRWYLRHSRTLRWVDGRTVRLVVATDITDRKQAEDLNRQQQEKLRLSSHLISVGEMASTLAHEINQPLAAIANYTMGCVRRLRAGSWDTQEMLAAMEKAGTQAERAGRIIQRVRELVRKREPQLVDCDINSVVSNAASLIEINAEKNNVQLKLELAPELPVVHADEIMLEQAILNLTRNGIESMQQTPPGERELTLRSRLDQGGAIEIVIADTGCGIPEAMVENRFESFFTTKPDGMGMGLGIARSIMELHNGRLWATRNPGRGSAFHLTLPTQQT